MSSARRALTARARRIVVKVGSSVLTDDGHVRRSVFGSLSRQIARLMDQKREVVLVSSGAIAIGGRRLGWAHSDRSVPEMQAAAAVGQIGLIESYQRRFRRYGRQVAQILVTRSGLENREHFLNARHTLSELLELGVLPIVNENDTVATEEIRFGDNDNLSATVVNLIGADLLIVLTDVDGLYPEPPPTRSQPYDTVESIDAVIRGAARASRSAFGRGGMITKLDAVRSAAQSGAATVIANGHRRDTLLRVAAGERVGTLFLPAERLRSRKHWLAFTARPRGTLVLDAGAARALVESGRSLLPAGIIEVRGRFHMGEPVSCVSSDGTELARGLVGYSSAEVERIRGQATGRIAQVLGYSNGDEVIHRNDLVVVGGEPGTDELPVKGSKGRG